MAIVLDDIEYTIKTASDNALDMLTNINTFMLGHDIKGADGKIVQFIPNAASPIWLIILGVGYMMTGYQRLIYACGQAFSIASCGPRQLYNLMEIGGLYPLPATSSTMLITVKVKADALAPVVLTSANTVTYNKEAFYVIYPYTIQPGDTEKVIVLSKTLGPLYIPSAVITKMDQTIPDIESVTNDNSLPGKLEETIAQSRYRLQNIGTRLSSVQGAEQALATLIGVTSCNILFNQSGTTDLTIDGVLVKPRSCAIILQGYSELIAKTYLSYVNMPAPLGDASQSYQLLSKQPFTVHWYYPKQIVAIVKIRYIRTGPSETFATTTAVILDQLSNSLQIGVPYTQAYMLAAFANYTEYQIVGLQMSIDNGITWTSEVVPGATHTVSFDTSKTQLVEVGIN